MSNAHTAPDRDALDNVAAGITILAGALFAIYFYAEVSAGLIGSWNTIVSLASSVFLGDFVGGGFIEEDGAIVDFIFDIRERFGI